ncbi:MAG: hypothetical protein M1828_006788 [Chrysothrix sp. TS-e1954]|nr:MAG: hypothetical protein M1828_006788 [Chrysothrix sp. TS-e1954]
MIRSLRPTAVSSSDHPTAIIEAVTDSEVTRSAYAKTNVSHALKNDILNATLGFGAIFVVSLPSRTDHQDALTLASSLTDIKIEWVEGIHGKDVSDKALPSGADAEFLGPGNVGSWRAHMNALQTIISRNLSSALICEDDIDWDIRLKGQLQDFATGTRTLTQPLKDGRYIDPTLASRDSDPKVEPLRYDLGRQDSETTVPPLKSAYGDDWDLLWIGHCGANMARARDRIPKARYVIPNDETVTSWETREGLDKSVREQYPGRDRVIHHAMGPICTFAYGVSLQGARKILYHIGLKDLRLFFDNLLAGFCDHHRCLTSQPSYFSHFRAAGPIGRDSEIQQSNNAHEIRQKATSENIRWSVRVNLKELVNGEPIADQYPDY